MRSFTIQLCALAIALVAGCATHRDADVGTLQIPLVQHDRGGTLYRLSAQFAISGPGRTLTVDGNVDAPAVSVSLHPGDYTVRVLDGWHLERSVGGQPFEPIDAQLGSVNPVAVTVSAGDTATVVFTFLIDLANRGTLSITFGVLRLHAHLLATLHATEASGALAGYVDYPPRFTLSYALTSEGTVNVPPRFHIADSLLDELVFTDDPLGVLAAGGPVSGGSLEYRVEVEPDDSQVLLLTYGAPDGAPPRSLSAAAIPLTPKLPVDQDGVPAEPGDVGLSTTTAFTLDAGDPGRMTGMIDLEFVPSE